MARKKIYDKYSDRLVFLDRTASSEFWDDQWEVTAEETFKHPPRFNSFVKVSKKYLSSNSKILEGGCGLGVVVNALHNARFSVTGIDFAPQVIKKIKLHWPHLNVSCGDVRSLEFEDDSFDGYWSLGVIEHFPDGYEDIGLEMTRVIREGGYLFLTFPSFNSLRQLRAKNQRYENLVGKPSDYPDFYQFALNPKTVEEEFKKFGFSLIERKYMGSLDGFAEETVAGEKIRNFLNRIYPRLGTAISLVMDSFFGSFLGHSVLLVLRKN